MAGNKSGTSGGKSSVNDSYTPKVGVQNGTYTAQTGTPKSPPPPKK